MSNTASIYRPQEAAAYIGVSRSTIYRWEATLDDFPKRLKVGPRTAGWRKSDLDRWLDRQAGEEARK